MSTALGEYGNSNSMHIFRSKLTRSAGLCGKEFVVMAGALLTTALHQVNAGTINASSPALVDVATAISLAKDDVIAIVPAGTENWAKQSGMRNRITLQGQTTISGS